MSMRRSTKGRWPGSWMALPPSRLSRVVGAGQGQAWRPGTADDAEAGRGIAVAGGHVGHGRASSGVARAQQALSARGQVKHASDRAG